MKAASQPGPLRSRARLRLATLVIFSVGLWTLHWFYWPVDKEIAKLAGERCRAQFQGARTPADSAKIDDMVFVVTNDTRRFPNCGELRRKNLI